MAQAGFTPIQLYFSSTAAAVPLAANLAQGELAINIVDGKLYYENNSGVVTLLASAAGSLGDVVGPASATDNALARFDLTTGKLIQNSVGILSDAGILTGLTGITSSGSITFSSLTSGRVPYATTAGLLTDSANLLYSGTDLTVYGITVGRGAGSVATNTAVGASALAANTTGSQNVAIGPDALLSNTTGDLNVAIGGREQALNNWGPMRSNTAGSQNTAVGSGALATNSTASANSAFGYMAMFGNSTGASNVGLGYQALRSNTTASNNTAVGYQAAYTNVTGQYNTAVGTQALYANNGSNSYNTAVGYRAAYSTVSQAIDAFGYQALYNNTTGASNAAFGFEALVANTSGSENVAFGRGSLSANTTGNGNTAVGYQAINSLTGATQSNNTAVGYQALKSMTNGQLQTAIGYQALTANTGDTYCTAIGARTLSNNTTGSSNFAGGDLALNSNTTGSNSVAIGTGALQQNTTASNNTAVGYQAGYANITGLRNTVVGYQSALSLNGNDNTIVGAGGSPNLTTGAGNVTVGDIAQVATRIFNLTTQNDRIIMGHDNITNAYVKVAWTVTSDARDKMDFGDVPHGLSFLREFSPVSYYMRKSRETEVRNGRKRYGYKAQDILALEGADPVIIDNEEQERLKYNGEALVPVLHNAIIEMADMIDQLKAEIAALKGA